jgi:hypothetical protein
VATPIDLGRLLTIDKPSQRVGYKLEEHDPEALRAAVSRAVSG